MAILLPPAPNLERRSQVKLVDGTCPKCGASELGLYLCLSAKPLGEFSLAGAQSKFSARYVPVLECLNPLEGGMCDFTLTGRVEDGHAVFDPNASQAPPP